MITLKNIDEDNFSSVLHITLPPEQNKFVAPNVVSLAQAWLHSDTARPYAICEGDEVVGFIMLDWDEDERTAGIWRFMIAPEHQGKGYGRAAATAAITLARENDNIDLMYLDYVQGNDVARGLYYSLGFRENGDIEEGEIVMTMPVTDNPKVGKIIADIDDIDEIIDLFKEYDKSNGDLPPQLTDAEELKKALDDKKVRRYVLMGDAIAVEINGSLYIGGEYSGYSNEILRIYNSVARI